MSNRIVGATLRDRPKLNNRGFSLVELLVSFAILTIVIVAIVGMMATGMGFFKTTSNTISLQNEYQSVMTMIREYTVDCNGGIAFDGSNLYLVYTSEVGGVTQYTIHFYNFDAATSTLTYGRTLPSAVLPGTPPAGGSVLSTRVSLFDITITPPTGVDPGRKAIETDIQFTSDTRSYRAEQTIAIRNNVELATGAGAYAALHALLIP